MIVLVVQNGHHILITSVYKYILLQYDAETGHIPVLLLRQVSSLFLHPEETDKLYLMDIH